MKERLLIFMILAFGTNACQNSPSKYIYNQGTIYGTIYSIIYESPGGKDLQEDIDKKLKEYTFIFSTYEPQSTISKINNNMATDLETEFVTCYNRAMEISEITGGAFDITAGPMVNAWGFGPEERKNMTPEIIDSLKKITGYKKISIKNGEVIKENPGMKLDMSAISKGYTSDLIANFLKGEGCKNYMVEIGGEVAAFGKNEKRKTWTIGISKPNEDALFANSDIQAKVELPDHAMATSGNYRNFYVENGKKYAHTIDPKTGYPVQHSLLSATVLANDCMTADAFATAFMVLGLEKSIDVSQQIQEIEVYFIYVDENGNNQVFMSEDFESHLVE